MMGWRDDLLDYRKKEKIMYISFLGDEYKLDVDFMSTKLDEYEKANQELSDLAKAYSIKAAMMERFLAGEDVKQVIADYEEGDDE